MLASPCDATRHVGLDRTQKLMEERDLQTRLEEDMLPMTRSFLEAAKAINQRIGDDNKVGISLGRWHVVQARGVLTGGCVWRCRNSKRPRMTWKTMWLRYGNAVPRQWKGVRGVTACALMRCGDRSPRQNTRWKPRTGARGAPCAARWQCCLPCPPRSCLCIS